MFSRWPIVDCIQACMAWLADRWPLAMFSAIATWG
jgi:hypothetical protein